MKAINSVFKKDIQDFRVKIGTFNKRDPKTIYVEGCSYITPEDDFNINEVKGKLSNILSRSIKKSLDKNNVFCQEFISIVDVPYERMKTGKKSYLNIEFHLKQLNNYSFKEITKDSDGIMSNVVSYFEDYAISEGFSLSKNK